MYYIILDMEWNQALDRAHTVQQPILLRGEIIQIGAVKADEHFNLVDTLKINVAPKYYKKMNRHVEKITGITNEMLAKGEKFPEAFNRLKEWCGEEFRFITWGFDDIAMLADNLELHGLDRSYGSDYVNLQLIYKNQIDNERVQWSLSDAVERLQIPMDAQAHDAMNDAWFTYQVCKQLDMEKGLAEYSGMSAGQRPVIAREIFRDVTDIRTITTDERFTAVPCPDECQNTLTNGEWLSMGAIRKTNICTCPKHGEFLVKLVCKRAAADRWTVTRSIYRSDEEAKSGYLKKLEKQHAAIERRRAAKEAHLNFPETNSETENSDDDNSTV